MRFVIQGLDCLNIHSHNTIDDKDVKIVAMDESDERETEEERGMKGKRGGRKRHAHV